MGRLSLINAKGDILGILCVLIMFLFFACDNKRVYEAWEDMEDQVWNEDSIYQFTFEIEDSLAFYNLNFGVRNTNMYPYQNLWLLTSVEGRGNEFLFQDTIQLSLANTKGDWYGKKSASLYTYVVPLYRQLKFYSKGTYTFSIAHGMRKKELNGVSSFGFRIERTK